MSKIKLGKTGVEIIKEWVIKTFLKQQPKGVLTTLPKKDFVELNTGITAERLMRNGVDPNSIKNVDQVENIINQLNKPRAVAADSPEGKGITEALFGKRGQVIEADFGKPFSEEVKNVKKRIDSGVATTVEKMLAMEPIDAMKEANKVIKREGPYKNLSQEDAKKILQDTEDHIFERNIKPKETDINFDEGATDEVTKAYNDAVKKGKFKGTEEDFRNKIDDMMDEDFAIGGRVGFKKGMDRRTFMKIMGGLTTIPILGKFFKGAEVAAPVAEKAVQAAKGVPPYFFDLVNKIKTFGEPRRTPSYRERVVEYQYTGKDGIEYELVEELDTGNIKITKDKIGGANYGDESFEVIEDRTEMNFVKGQGDEATRGTPADEYEEYKVEFDQDGTVADASEIDEVSKMEIIKEVTDEAPSIKKAGGGIARMLGE